MRRQARRVEYPAIVPCLKNSSCSWGGSCELDPAKRPKKPNSRAVERPVSSCSDCMTRSLLFVEVRVPGSTKRDYEC